MKHTLPAALAVVVSLVLSACGGGSDGSGVFIAPPAPVSSSATLSAMPASIQLIAGSGTAVTLTVTNTSTSATATAISARLPAAWPDVIQDAGNCATLAPQAQCTLRFSPGTTAHPAAVVGIQGQNADATSVTIAVGLPNSAALGVSGTPLSLIAGSGTPGSITVTNASSVLTATNINADPSATALAGKVTVDASRCASVSPGASCALLFTPQNTAVTLTSFPIKGDNTSQASGAIQIASAAVAQIAVAGSPLVLQGTTGVPIPGALTVTNTSSVLTATNIGANIAGALATAGVMQDASQCASLVPGASCILSFMPGSQAVPGTTVAIQGTNTSVATASIAVNSAPQASIGIVAGTPLTLSPGGTSATMTIQNNSSTENALDVRSDLTSTALNGLVTESANSCASVAPGASCTLTFTPGGALVSQTNFPIQGTNTTSVTGAMAVSVAIGDSFGGGTVACLASGGGAANLIAATVDNSTGIRWNNGANIVTGATSNSDGAANTATIVITQGAGSYAAQTCRSSTTGGFADWYLPAKTELNCLNQNKAAVGGFGSGVYFTSTELNVVSAWAQSFSSGAPRSLNKSLLENARCVRAFTP